MRVAQPSIRSGSSDRAAKFISPWHAVRIQHDLGFEALAEAVDAVAELVEWHLGADQVRDVEATAEQVEHLLPGAEHLAADDRVQRQALEDEVLGELLDRDVVALRQ